MTPAEARRHARALREVARLTNVPRGHGVAFPVHAAAKAFERVARHAARMRKDASTLSALAVDLDDEKNYLGADACREIAQRLEDGYGRKARRT